MIEEQVLSLMRQVFKNEEVDVSCSQRNCKEWDSMNQLNLVVELEMEFGISLEPEEIGKMVCFEDVVNLVKSKL